MVMWVSVTARPTVVPQRIGLFRWVTHFTSMKLRGSVPTPE